MRRAASAITVLAATAAVMAVPVLARPVAQAHAVAPHISSLGIGPRPALRGVLGFSTRPQTHRFDLVGATWRRGTLDSGATSIQVRVHVGDKWSGWQSLSATDGGADGGTQDARRAQSVTGDTVTAEPIYVGSADGVQARVVGAGHVPADLHVLLVDGGKSAADANPQPVRVWGGDVADASVDQPTIYTRADWGADESLRKQACPSGPDYSPTIKMGFIHHTDSGNGYTRGAVPGIIRSIYAYHVRANGWCDIGYNYLVDRFGRVWEGRYGGITKAVLGAHTGGFNYDSFGVSLIGSYDRAKPSAAMLSAVENLFAWRLGTYYLDPNGTSTLVADSFSGSRYRSGTTVKFKTISGHRNADLTTCPGTYAYGDLPDIRTATRQAMGAGFVAPSVSADTAQMANGAITIKAGAIAAETWALTVTDATGAVVRSISGSANRSADVAATWDLNDNVGTPVLPGAYTLTLSGADANGDQAVPWTTDVNVTPPVTLTAPAQTTLDAPVTVTGRGIPGHVVNVSVATATGPQPVGSFTVSPRGKWSAGTTAVTADRDLAFTVTDPAVAGYSKTKTTSVGPALSAPATEPTFVPAGQPLTLSGTALPAVGATVQLVTVPVAGGTATTGSPVPVNTDGSWTTSFTPTVPTSYAIVDGRGLATTAHLVYPVSPASATGPTAGYAGRTVTLTGNGGNAPVPVTLSVRQPGTAWTVAKSVTARSNGRFSIKVPLANSPGQQTGWRVTTGYGPTVSGAVDIQPVFAPTVTGPRRAAWHTRRTLTGTAVPGDVVTIWAAPAGTPATSTRWAKAGTATAAADDTWSFTLRINRDTAWRVTSPSGTSAVGTTVVVPTIHAPAHVVARALAVISGRAIPGQAVTLYHRISGSTVWAADATLKAAADGTWSVRRHPRSARDYRAVSHGQTSRTISLTVD